MDNPKAVVSNNGFGKCVLARSPIRKGEIVAEFDGIVLPRREFSELHATDPVRFEEIRDHAIQIAEDVWRDSDGIARYLNHSCEPNCGISGVNVLVAMRDINTGEEMTWDYEMTEDISGELWRMKCECGRPSCRQEIGCFGDNKELLAKKYRGYISAWLVGKYDLDSLIAATSG